MKNYAVITGASSGIGKEFAKKLSEMGYSLVLVARRKERLEEIAATLKTKADIITADLEKEEECHRLLKELAPYKIDIFINNAGFGDCEDFISSDLEKELQMIQVNVKAVHILTKGILQKMEKRDYGYLLNVASIAGLMPAGPYMATYYATKAYVASLTRAIAREQEEAGSNVYVGCLCPGPVDTEFNSVANVEFALKSITPKKCVQIAIRQMIRRKVVIIPSLSLRMGNTFKGLLPQNGLIRILSEQQKKKLGDR